MESRARGTQSLCRSNRCTAFCERILSHRPDNRSWKTVWWVVHLGSIGRPTPLWQPDSAFEGRAAARSQGKRSQPQSGRPVFLLDTSRYLSSGSDIVANLILIHQAQVHNMIAQLNIETKAAIFDERALNAQLNPDAPKRWDSTTRRIQSNARSLVQAIFFSEEAKISEPFMVPITSRVHLPNKVHSTQTGARSVSSN